MQQASSNSQKPTVEIPWKAVVAKYQKPRQAAALWQMVNSLVPYLGLWCLMYFTVSVSWWLTLPIALLASGFLVRLFIIFHDCGHGSFFSSGKANAVLGHIVGHHFTPYHHWRWEHAIHHATSGDLDRRGTGDVWTLTVQDSGSFTLETGGLPACQESAGAFRAGATVSLPGAAAFPSAKAPRRERVSVYVTNLGILAVGTVLSLTFGIKNYLILQSFMVCVAVPAAFGFYVQHQFEGVYWQRGEDWDYCTAALKGVLFTNCQKSSSGFPATSGSITSTTSARAYQIITSRNATAQSRCFRPSNPSRCLPASSLSRSGFMTNSTEGWLGSLRCGTDNARAVAAVSRISPRSHL
jgi:omega-6 fatty acid desaturase (delta-12 desaturase)